MDAAVMTRENKLALVVGFGLFLFVGILVSDHFSVARGQETADLRPDSDPLNHSRNQDPSLIDVARPAPTPATVVDTYQTVHRGPDRYTVQPQDPIRQRPQDPVRTTYAPTTYTSSDVPVIQIPNLQDPLHAPDRPANITADATLHDVRSNENLTTICDLYYGDTSLVQRLAEYNGLANPNMLRVGHRLRVPARSVLITGQHRTSVSPPLPRERTSSPPPAPKTRTYVVQSNDTLSEIAQRELGSAKRWRELYDANKSVIKNPDRLIVGATLKLPR
ncbi:MAG: LysM peptidoglycan-binding domain-containing protein [Planctomycetota bacterium]